GRACATRNAPRRSRPSARWDRAPSVVVIPAEAIPGLCPGSREPESSNPQPAFIAPLRVTGSRLCARPAQLGSLGRDDSHIIFISASGREREQARRAAATALQAQFWSMPNQAMTRVTYAIGHEKFFGGKVTEPGAAAAAALQAQLWRM